MSNTIKTLGKIAGGIIAVSAAVGVVAGIADQIDQAKERRKAKETGKEIHKMKGPYEKYFKRPLDVFLSTGALIVFSPIMGVTAVLVKKKLGSPVLFTQERTGLNEKPFKLYKFRSMTNEKDETGKLLPDEVRLTSFGKKLRSTSLDELPSLFNILKGNMSVMGPRPLPIRYIPFYSEEEKHRHDVRPGLSGRAQVHGRNYVTWEDKFKMDVEYANNITFLGDLTLLFQTFGVVAKHDNIDTGSFIEHNGHIYRPLDVERKDIIEN